MIRIVVGESNGIGGFSVVDILEVDRVFTPKGWFIARFRDQLQDWLDRGYHVSFEPHNQQGKSDAA